MVNILKVLETHIKMPPKTAYNKIKPNAIKFCFNCGAKINGSLWTLIEEGIIKEK